MAVATEVMNTHRRFVKRGMFDLDAYKVMTQIYPATMWKE